MAGLRRAVAKQKMDQKNLALESEAAAKANDAKELDFTTVMAPISKQERDRIMKLPQHFHNGKTNPEWLSSRRHVMTGSKIANLTGNGYNTPQQMLQHMLWPTTHRVNEIFCSYGNRHESTCEHVLIEYLTQRVQDPDDPLESFTITHPGLIKDLNCLGYSPDGHVLETYIDGTQSVFLSEYKCPFSKRNMNPGPNYFGTTDVYDPDSSSPDIYNAIRLPLDLTCAAMHDGDCSKKTTRVESAQYTLPIPAHYYDQVQWGMGLGIQQDLLYTKSREHGPTMKCYFVVWTPNYSQLCEVPFDKTYAEHLRQTALSYMSKYYFPAVELKLSGDLEYGKTRPRSPSSSPPRTRN